MPRDEPVSLWNFGEPEPWRRGRTILVTIFCFYAVLHGLVVFALLTIGSLEAALFTASALVLWWLIFAFIWLGTNWLRWLLGAWTMLNGFALFIWGILYESAVQWSAGVVNLLIGAFCFAPSVHFFAKRQKERIRWPEKLIVAAVFLILLASVSVTFVGVLVSRSEVEREARHYGEEALRRIFAHDDTVFLVQQASDRWRSNPYGNVAIGHVLSSKYMLIGRMENTRVTGVQLRTLYEFPAKLRYAGVIDGEAFAKCGPVLLRLEIQRPDDEWRINALWWRCLNTPVLSGSGG